MVKIRRALVSVSNKEGLPEFVEQLTRRGTAIVSSGGTAELLRRHGVAVTEVADYTGSPEILDGRVKTLHPRVFGGILARATEAHRAQLEQQEIPEIDLVVVNLYPFEQTIARPDVTVPEAVEQIDIGGPSLVRAAAKNHERVAVVVDPADYPVVVEALDRNHGAIDEPLRRVLAGRAFAHTARYDAAIAGYFSENVQEEAPLFPDDMVVSLKKFQDLRYGENPHQEAAFYALSAGWPSVPAFEQLSGKALSYNNLGDVDAAWTLVADLPQTAVCVIKHANPCGAAFLASGDPAEVFRRAKATDPVSAFGGIVACNVPVTAALAAELKEMFLEVVVAPAYEPEALATLQRKKKLRVLRHRGASAPVVRLRSACGGILAQHEDLATERLTEAGVPTQKQPSPAQLSDLEFAWRVCKHVKSNAVVFARDGQLVGVGAGQMSRVDAVKLAATKAQLPLAGTVAASDAFLPFRDGVDEIAAAGAVAIVQPGGSIRDDEVVAAANEHGLAMLLTGVRHFRH